jgi:hypothetical protein
MSRKRKKMKGLKRIEFKGVFKVDFDTHSPLLKEDNFFHDCHAMLITSLKCERHHVAYLAPIFKGKLSTRITRFFAV